jgi:hypothetical protein
MYMYCLQSMMILFVEMKKIEESEKKEIKEK